MTSFIHTADWQIGKPYLQISDEQKRFKLKQERLNVISRISEVINKESLHFVLIAGDLFDSPTPSISVVAEVLELIGQMEVPVLAIPGNHDHGALGTIWHSDDFIRYQEQMAPNFSLLLERKPVELESAFIFPCPLLRNKDTIDPTTWLRNLDWSKYSSNKAKIVLAHGAIQQFGGRDYSLDDDAQSSLTNLIDLDALSKTEIDYIALGDWHNLKKLSDNAWYSGTPEPDRFDQGENNQRGQILKVDVIRDSPILVRPISTGRIQWHNLTFKFNTDNDLMRLEKKIEQLISGRVLRDLLRIQISGGLSLSAYKRYQLLMGDLDKRLLRLRIKGECFQNPGLDEIEDLTRRFEDPLISQVASQLQERLKSQKDLNSYDSSILRVALCELYRFALGPMS